jgi:hypothetical protein
MDLVKAFDYRDKKSTFSVAQAVEHACDGADYDRGHMETVAATARQTSEHFTAKGCLTTRMFWISCRGSKLHDHPQAKGRLHGARHHRAHPSTVG